LAHRLRGYTLQVRDCRRGLIPRRSHHAIGLPTRRYQLGDIRLKLIGRRYLRWGIPCLAAAVLLAACGSANPLSASTHPFNTRAPVPVETPPTRAPAISTTAGLTWSHPVQPFRGLTSLADSPPNDFGYNLVCPTASFCAESISKVIKDRGGIFVNKSDGAVSVYSDGHWSTPTMPFGSGDGIRQLVCPTASFCAVNTGGRKVSFYSDGHWSPPTMPFGSRVDIGWMVCPTASFCALESDGNSVVIYSDGHWSAPSMPPGSRDGIAPYGLMCLTASFCAVNNFVGTKVSFYSDGHWIPPTMPFGSGDGISQLVCPTASFCAASSDGSPGSVGRKVSFYSDGHWSTPTMPFGSDDVIAQLVCPTASFCAVNTGGRKVSFYSDGHWSPPTMPFGSRGRIDGMVCPTASFCVVTSGEANELSNIGGWSVSMSEG